MGQFDGWLGHRSGLGRSLGARDLAWRLAESLQGTAGLGDGLGRDGCVARGGLHAGVAQQDLDDAGIGAVLQ